MAILSISIPTYNRSSLLEDLVNSILSLETDEIEVVVTDNCSTDDTLEMLGRINDSRLKVFVNKEPVPAYYNMILSLFNASGKYVLYCNDRDVIYVDRLLNFIEFLRNSDYSYICTSRTPHPPTYKLIEYEKGFESLMHQSYTHHPTGSVYNVGMMKKYLKKESYKSYIDAIFTWDFLLRDIVMYCKSALYDDGLWTERSSKIVKKKMRSGSVYKGLLYFDPEFPAIYVNEILNQVIGNPHFSLTKKQEEEFILHVIKVFKGHFITSKRHYSDNRECAHYGIKPRYLGYFSMKKIYQKYISCCEEIIERSGYKTELKEQWNTLADSISKSILEDCLKADMAIIKRCISRSVPQVILNQYYKIKL